MIWLNFENMKDVPSMVVFVLGMPLFLSMCLAILSSVLKAPEMLPIPNFFSVLCVAYAVGYFTWGWGLYYFLVAIVPLVVIGFINLYWLFRWSKR